MKEALLSINYVSNKLISGRCTSKLQALHLRNEHLEMAMRKILFYYLFVVLLSIVILFCSISFMGQESELKTLTLSLSIAISFCPSVIPI